MTIFVVRQKFLPFFGRKAWQMVNGKKVNCL
jgi:hypothetical protein